jgi:hypothetical protein
MSRGERRCLRSTRNTNRLYRGRLFHVYLFMRIEDRKSKIEDRDLLSSILSITLPLPRLPEFQNPFLSFFLARAEFRVGIRERVLYTWDAALIRHDLASRNIITQR